MARRKRRSVLSAVLIVLGVLVLLSPIVLTHVKNTEQQRIASQYSANVATLADAERDRILQAARTYNTQLPPVGARDPWVNGVDTTSAGYQAYVHQLDVKSVMARLKIPAVGIDLPVYHGTSQQTLAAGVGHLYGTALPVGGAGSHAVLTGHTGLATLTMFDNLTHVTKGDVFVIETMGQTLTYQVDQIVTVLPDQLDAIRPEPGRDLVTLVTCTPYGINSHRLLVRGERVPDRPAAPQTYHSPWQPWMIASIVLSLLAVAYLLWWAASRRRHRRDEVRP